MVGNLADLRYLVHPPVHNDGWAVGGEDELYVGVQVHDEVDEAFLPVDVQADLRLVHKEHVVLVVFHQYGEQYGKDLLLTAGELVGDECLADL